MRSLDRQRPLYVEFVGFPGAGKTTVSLETVPLLIEQEYRCVVRGNGRWVKEDYGFPKTSSHRNLGILGKARLYLTLHTSMWRLAARAYGYVLSEGRVSENRIRAVRSLLKTLHSMKEACQLVHGGKADLLLYTQGFAGYLREMAASDRPDSRRKLVRIADAIADVLAPARVVLVVFELDPELAVARIQQRPEVIGRYDRMSREEALRELQQQSPHLETVVDSLREAGTVEAVLRIDAAGAPGDNARLIAGFVLEQLCTSQPARPPVPSPPSAA